MQVSIPSIYSTQHEMKEFLQRIGVTYSFKTKEEYVQRIKVYQSLKTFPWRKDQLDIIQLCLDSTKKNIVVGGLFGAGKSTMILGAHVLSIINGIYTPYDALFISFNVCIKNELTQKLRSYGIPANRTRVRTFDSIIYEICKVYKYEYLDLPNFEGKRKFVYKICSEINTNLIKLETLSDCPKAIYIDECQDLEHQTLLIFETFFKDCRIVFVGDIFQSISKEPRETLLWHLLHQGNNETYTCYSMTETPRVPHTILSRVKTSLMNYYPEFTPVIKNWTSSSNEYTSDIEWHRFYNYSGIFSEMKEFIEEHGPIKCMILLFSSAITVKGAIGDVARFRSYLQSNGFQVNTNYKKMDHDKLFLSTVNSSKGLERDHVFIVLTFPLERAFVNFSNDLVLNLINVGITRAKKKVIFYVPAYEDKFSQTLKMFDTCPIPNKNKIREGKMIKDFEFSDYMNMEHCVTELIKQSIIKYDTRIKLKEHVKLYESKSIFDSPIPFPKIEIEEEKAFVGILIENLITSSWIMKWPYSGDLNIVKNHPLYTHCFKKIENIYKKYEEFIKTTSCSDSNHFTGIYYYSQLHLAMYNKIFIDLSPNTISYLKTYWNSSLKSSAKKLCPNQGSIKIQNNMKMPWLTGVSDVIVETEDKDIFIWELKASVDMDWKDNALTQAILYALMTGKNWTRLVLMNPFRNEVCHYYFNMKQIMTLRQLVINDILIWNANCYLSKRNNKEYSNHTNTILTCSSDHQSSIIQFLSPTKIDIVYNASIKQDKCFHRDILTKIEKLSCEGQEADIISKKCHDIIHSSQYKDCLCIDRETFEKKMGIDIDSIGDILEYEKNEDLTFELDQNDTLVQCILMASILK